MNRPASCISATAIALFACGVGNVDPNNPVGLLPASSDAGVGCAAADASAINAGDPGAFVLRPEWNCPCVTATPVDVNLGNAPESFVRAAYCQITGAEPPMTTMLDWANQLRTVSYVRRVDVVRTLCKQQNKSCTLAYSIPWMADVPRTATCVRKTTRDVGAVMMFFFHCPNQQNCTMDWANTHAWGMESTDPLYGSGANGTGYYDPTNVWFWERELLDARYAGLQFLMPNVYGPDTGQLKNLEAALTAIDGLGGGIQVALFNDTWAWGKPPGGPLMNPVPDLSVTDTAAQRIYDAQWKPFFHTISKPHWYTINGGAPLIYFYNAGTLKPTAAASAVIAKMKQLFEAEFGVAPFVDVDRGYGQTASGDAQFVWDTFGNFPGTYMGTATTVTGGLTFANSMVKWDSLGRDTLGAIATPATRIFKGPEILTQVLQASSGANLLLLETWNDLGEGTGITRNYDYYVGGKWLPPDAFMGVIRASQCSN